MTGKNYLSQASELLVYQARHSNGCFVVGELQSRRAFMCALSEQDCHILHAQLVTGHLALLLNLSKYPAVHFCGVAADYSAHTVHVRSCVKCCSACALLNVHSLDCGYIDKHQVQTDSVVRSHLEPSSFVSVAKYSKILSGPLRSRMRFSYLKNVLCLVESGKSCQDCSRQTTACCKGSIAAVCLVVCVWGQAHTFSSGCMVATSSAFAVSMQPAAIANATGNSQSFEDCLIRKHCS